MTPVIISFLEHTIIIYCSIHYDNASLNHKSFYQCMWIASTLLHNYVVLQFCCNYHSSVVVYSMIVIIIQYSYIGHYRRIQCVYTLIAFYIANKLQKNNLIPNQAKHTHISHDWEIILIIKKTLKFNALSYTKQSKLILHYTTTQNTV